MLAQTRRRFSALSGLSGAELSDLLAEMLRARSGDVLAAAEEVRLRCRSMAGLPRLALAASVLAQARPDARAHGAVAAVARAAFARPELGPQTRLEVVEFCHSLACCDALQLPAVRDYLQLTEPRRALEFGQTDLERNRPGFVLKGEAGGADSYPQFRVPVEEDPLLLHRVLLAWRKTRSPPPPLLAMLGSADWFSQLCFKHETVAGMQPSRTAADVLGVLRGLGSAPTSNFQSPMGLFAHIAVNSELAMLCLDRCDFTSDGELLGKWQLHQRLLRAEGIDVAVVKSWEWDALTTAQARHLYLYPKMFSNIHHHANQDLFLKTVAPQLRPVDPQRPSRPQLTRMLPF